MILKQLKIKIPFSFKSISFLLSKSSTKSESLTSTAAINGVLLKIQKNKQYKKTIKLKTSLINH